MQNSPNPYPLGFSPFYIPLVHGNLKSYGLPSICSKAVKFGFYCWNPFWATPPWSGPPCGWHFSTHKAGDRISHRYLLARRKQQWICERWSRAHPTFIMVSYPHHWHQVLIEQAWRWHFTKQTTEGNNFFTWRNYFSYICSRKKKGGGWCLQVWDVHSCLRKHWSGCSTYHRQLLMVSSLGAQRDLGSKNGSPCSLD